MELLAYWIEKQYKYDSKKNFDYCFNSISKKFQLVEIGDTVWLFTSKKVDGEKEYYLAGKLIVDGKSENDARNSQINKISGQPKLSAYYQIENQDSIEKMIREYGFGVKGKTLGSSFQGYGSVKIIPPELHERILKHSQDLPRKHINK